MSGVVAGFSNTGDLVAVALTSGGAEVAAAGRRAIIMCHQGKVDVTATELAEVAATRRAVAHVQVVTNENLSSRLVGLSEKLDFLIAPDTVRWCEGFWSAAAFALRPGGHVAIISASADAAVHAAINDAASSAGMGYEQHVLACSPEALDDAVAYEFASSRRNSGHSHARAHVDVFVYARLSASRTITGVKHVR